MNRRNFHLLVSVVVLIIASIAWAGSTFAVKCQNEKCHFKDEVSFGGGFAFEQITGYCMECQKFVYLTWPLEDRGGEGEKRKPEPVDQVWDATTGRTNDLYACPNCTNAFLAIRSAHDLCFCPRCGQESLGLELVENYD